MKKILHIFDSTLVKLIMSVMPSVWFTFFSIFYQQTKIFVNESGELTITAIVINVIMLVIMLMFTAGVAIDQGIKHSIGIKNEKMYNSIMNTIEQGNKILINKQIENLMNKSAEFESSDYSDNRQYRDMLTLILNNLIICLSEITQLSREKFVATYFYKTNSAENWSSITSDEGYKGVARETLFERDESVLKQLLPNVSTIFYYSKENALQEKKYIEDMRDKEQVEYELPMGSIFGANWRTCDIDGQKILFENIITVATYGVEICSKKDIATKKAIIESLLKVFRQQFLQTALSFGIISC